jgi:glycerol-3-phosphate acyltransferase PlsY
MISIFYQFLFLIITYFIAAIPFGFLLTKIFVGKDIREYGSQNIGATNVTRIVGKKIGFLTFILDGAKGAIMVILARFYFSQTYHLHWFLVIVAFTSVCAHVFPIYLNFKGGKGVATAIAVLFALDPVIGFLVSCFWIMCFALCKISSVSSLVAIFSSIILSSHYHNSLEQIIFCVILFLLILIRHKQNIILLISSEENSFDNKKNKNKKSE